MTELVCFDLGRAAYEAAVDIQRHLVAALQAEATGRAYLLLVEHDPPVITLGRRGRMEHVLVSRARLAAKGIELHAARRGGDVTYHGPGQLVAYPIVRLSSPHRTVRDYVRGLEETVIRLLERIGLEGRRRPGYPGVWAGPEKVAAIGVAVSRWVAYHGLALNVSADLAGFDLIVPCGIRDGGVTSLSRLLGRPIPMERVKQWMLRSMREVFAFDTVRRVAAERIMPTSTARTGLGTEQWRAYKKIRKSPTRAGVCRLGCADASRQGRTWARCEA